MSKVREFYPNCLLSLAVLTDATFIKAIESLSDWSKLGIY